MQPTFRAPTHEELYFDKPVKVKVPYSDLPENLPPPAAAPVPAPPPPNLSAKNSMQPFGRKA